MNYSRHYDALIERAKTRSILPGIYFETHHIIPKCLGGNDSKENLIKLFPEEHYVAHQLLVKIYPNNPKIILAARMMSITSNNLKRTNKEYKWLKERFIKSKIGVPLSVEIKNKISETVKNSGRKPPSRIGITHSEETKKKIGIASKSRERRKTTPEQKMKISKSNMGRRHTEETKQRISENHKGMLGKNHSDDTKRKISLANNLRPIVLCPHCNKSGKSAVMYRWHFDNCKLIIHNY